MKRPLRAFLLAAGFGTRLRPITLHTPKCLVSVAGQPLLGRWLRKLEYVGCEEVLINTHYLAEQVVAFLDNWSSSSLRIVTTHEPVLLGTAGSLLANKSFFEGATGLLIHADNAMSEDLQGILTAHSERPKHCLLTMLTFTTDRPESCGIVQTNIDGIVTNFYEKVDLPPGDCANGALYAFDSDLIQYISEISPPPADFSTEVIPNLIGHIQTWHTDQPYLDIGNPDALAKAQNLLSPNP